MQQIRCHSEYTQESLTFVCTSLWSFAEPCRKLCSQKLFFCLFILSICAKSLCILQWLYSSMETFNRWIEASQLALSRILLSDKVVWTSLCHFRFEKRLQTHEISFEPDDRWRIRETRNERKGKKSHHHHARRNWKLESWLSDGLKYWRSSTKRVKRFRILRWI